MALSTATVSIKATDLTAAEVDYRRSLVWATTNIANDTIIDTDGNALRVGSGGGKIFNAAGEASLSLWTPGEGSNPSSWQYYIHVDMPLKATKDRFKQRYGPFTITESANLADLVEEQEVPPVYLTTVTAALDEKVAEAEAARDQALSAVTVGVGGSGRSASTWEAAWAMAKSSLLQPSRRAALLQEWYAGNTGPRIPIDYDNPVSGEVVVSSQAQADALRGKLIEGHVVIAANDIELCDFVIRGDGEEHLISWSGVKNGKHIHHVEIDGQYSLTTNRGVGGSSGVETPGAGMVLEFCNLHSLSDGVYAHGGSIIRYNWIHDPILWPRDGDGGEYDSETDPHSDGIQGSGGSNIEIWRNFVDYTPLFPNSSNIVSGMIFNPTTQEIDGLEVHENYLAGGTYTIRLVLGGDHGAPTNVDIHDNVFGGGYVTGLINYDDAAPDWSGNIWLHDLTEATLTSGALLERVPIDVVDPFGLGFVATSFAIGGATAWGAANDARFVQCLTGGTLSKIALHATTQSGNISVGVYRGSRGRHQKKPTERLAYANATCPSGYSTIDLGESVQVVPGDFLALACDNTTAAFIGTTGTASALFGGLCLSRGSSYPLPSDASDASSTSGFRVPILAGLR